MRRGIDSRQTCTGLLVGLGPKELAAPDEPGKADVKRRPSKMGRL